MQLAAASAAFPLQPPPQALDEYCEGLAGVIVEAVAIARLSEARTLALEALWDRPECEKSLRQAYVTAADEKLSDEGYLSAVDAASPSPGATVRRSRNDDERCWDGMGDSKAAPSTWDRCCSLLPGVEASSPPSFASDFPSEGCVDSRGFRLCCDFFQGSPCYLRLPALREIALNVRVSFDESAETSTLSLEQDGFLRPFDVAAILWPAGYLLTLCVAAPRSCNVPEIVQAANHAFESRQSLVSPVAVELGAGIGAASIALALSLGRTFGNIKGKALFSPLVVATDKAPHALALSVANANRNGASVGVAQVDHTNATSLSQLSQSFATGIEGDNGSSFAIVIGSSLGSFFDGTDDPQSALWLAMDLLLDSDNPNAVTVLAHTKAEPLKPPGDGSFRLIRQIPGDFFGMETHSGTSSDFEISIFQRSLEMQEL